MEKAFFAYILGALLSLKVSHKVLPLYSINPTGLDKSKNDKSMHSIKI